MNNNKSSRKRPAVGEFVLIVVGVLVALLAESWWSERQDQRAERQIFVDAITEFQENIEILDTDISQNIAVYEYLLGVEAMSDSELMAISDEEASELLAIRNQNGAAFDPAMGTIDATVRSGDLRFIADHELRGHLARWSALLTRSNRMELQYTKVKVEGLWRKVPEFKADGKWAIEERREIREILVNTKFPLKLLMDTMVELRATAENVLERLGEVTQ
jgi:hypothetical protein